VDGDGYQINHLVTADDATWALGIPQDGPTEVRRLDPATGQTVATIDLPPRVTPLEILTVTGIVELGATPSWPEHLHTTTDHLWFLQPGGVAPDPLARVPLEAVLAPGEG
jgi:hypothetical protein